MITITKLFRDVVELVQWDSKAKGTIRVEIAVPLGFHWMFVCIFPRISGQKNAH